MGFLPWAQIYGVVPTAKKTAIVVVMEARSIADDARQYGRYTSGAAFSF